MIKEFVDISIQKEYIQNILDSQNSVIIICKNKKIQFVNKKFYEYFKADTNEELTTILKENFNGIEFDKWAEKSCKEKDDTRLVFYKKNKKYTFLANVKRLDEHNEYIITFNDISKLIEQEDSLILKNEVLNNYKNALDTFTIVSITDTKGIITYVNDKFKEVSKYSKKELIGQKHNIVRSPDMPKQVFKKMWKTIANKKVWKGIIKNRKKNGEIYFVNTVIYPVLDKEKNIIEYLALRVDITDLIKAKEKAQKALKTKSMFLANMSHEIRTPLNGIMGFTNLLTKKNLDSEIKEIVSIIDSSAETLLDIVNDILDVSKIESEGITLQESSSNLQKSLTQTSKLFQAKAREKNISYNVNIDIEECVVVDENRLKQVVSNLISNAIKFTPIDGKIDIKIISKQKKKNFILDFSIIDSGIGIPKEKQQKIFTPFSQADEETNKKFGGTGLGLSISSKIIKKMGGKIKLKSKENKGSKFYFQLKLNRCKTKIIQEDNKISLSKLTGNILIAEDHPVNQALIKAILNNKGKITQTIVKNGKIALETYKKNSFDLILMDINMPVMHGVNSLKAIREFERKKNLLKIPIIALTANAMDGDKEKYLSYGFNDYLAKPIQDQYLDIILNKYLNKSDFNLDKAIKETNIDKETFIEILKIFFENIGDDMDKLKNSIKEKQLNKISINAHKIAGSSSAIRFHKMFKIAKQIETKANNFQQINYKKLFKKLQKSLANYKNISKQIKS